MASVILRNPNANQQKLQKGEVRANLHRFSMGNLLSSKFLLFLFQFFYVQLKAQDYAVPDYYFINCGSSGNVTVTGWKTFVGDDNPENFSLSEPGTTVANSQSTDSSSSSLYGTARIFRKPSRYEFNIDRSGIYVVRFHFYAFTSSQAQGTDLYSARFNVSTSNFTLLSDFHVDNSTSTSNSPLIEEFLLNLPVGKFVINFTPSSSSVAFINAIEAFFAPDHFIPNSALPHVTPTGRRKDDYGGLLSYALRVIHRINVGGNQVTPENDTMGRIWVPDDIYLFLPDAVRDKTYNQAPNYETGKATIYDAPNPVYTTAKVLNNGDTQPFRNINASWRYNVSQNAKFLVRAHFCDFVRNASTDILQFYLYIYSDFGQPVDQSDINSLVVPFYFDSVVDSIDSGVMSISIGQAQNSDIKMAFLNGLEIMELISTSSSPSEANKKSKKLLYVIIGSVVGGVVLIIVSVILFWSCLRLRKAKPVETLDWPLPNLTRGSSYSRSTEKTVNGSPLPDLNLGLKIAFGEVLHATRNFHKDLLIGEGGFGKVYRGTLRNGTKVAIKRSEPGRTQGLPEFQTEIMVLSKIRHRHLVSLIGYCDERSEMILVYEFMDKGTLREHLYSSKGKPTETTSDTRLSWKKRLELCIDAAKGLNYLHTGLGGAIIHRDVKSTNILLDEHYVAKVADFGTSRLGALDETHVSTEVKGTFGYLDPEYFKCQILTQKSDVYSFGVVLLEVLCARSAIDNSLPREQANLADWGMSCIPKGELEMIVDPLLKGEINPDSLGRFGQIVQRCLQDCGTDRPNMIDVLWDLEYALQLQHTAPPRQPHEDSNTDVSYNLPMPVVTRLPSNSIALTEYEDEMDSDNALLNGSNTTASASEVFSQIGMQEAR